MVAEQQRSGVVFGNVELSRVVPAHTKRAKFSWVQAQFSVMGPLWRNIRKNMQSPRDMCDWCAHQFQDGESMGLGGATKGRNLLLCQTCVAALKPSEVP